ncbi:putative X8 domain-containing protein [Lupinus albus]|uniref:Putative X8 domain-containing protein n=1 Tax=Lupinus albus TaxID=3870 RepID=A0A6A4R6D0_LUPAL|nr:putative X8 domain-containing protein [Lupinus albus]
MATPNLSYFLLLTIVVGIIVGSNNMMKVDAALSWCVAKFSASPKVLEKQLDYACRNGADCAAIKSGGSCFIPANILNHASYVFNSFYQAKGSCNFAGAALISITDPSMSLLLFYVFHTFGKKRSNNSLLYISIILIISLYFQDIIEILFKN